MITPDRVRKDLRCAGAVKRYHTWPTVTTQTNADHTFHVLRIFRECYPGHMYGMRIVDAILYHDMPEIMVGDLPYPIKKNNPRLAKEIRKIEIEWMMDVGLPAPQLSEEEEHCVKMCDMLEMAEFSVYEMGLGNKYAEPVFWRIVQWYGEPDRKVRNTQTDNFIQDLANKVGEMNDERPVYLPRKSA